MNNEYTEEVTIAEKAREEYMKSLQFGKRRQCKSIDRCQRC
jgi:hypothetical protein